MKKITEATRNQQLTKSINSQDYVPSNRQFGRNRYYRRTHSKLSNRIADYNNIDMDRFFKKDELFLSLGMLGETDAYQIDLLLKGVLKEIQNQLKRNEYKLEFKVIQAALLVVMNTKDIYSHCSCPDFRFTHDWQSRRNGTNSHPIPDDPLDRPPVERNPDDKKGVCKHINLLYSNPGLWSTKVASVIINYVKTSKKILPWNYINIIFPKIVGATYKEALEQKDIFNGLLLDKDKEEQREFSLKKKDLQIPFKRTNPEQKTKELISKEEEEENDKGNGNRGFYFQTRKA